MKTKVTKIKRLLNAMLAFVLISHTLHARGKVTNNRLYRFPNPISFLKLSPNSRRLAYIEKAGSQANILKVLHIKTGKIYSIATNGVGASFVWAPHGHRLFYRTQTKSSTNAEIHSKIFAYDTKLRKSVVIHEISKATGFLSLDPKDLKIRTFAQGTLLVHQISYPGSRLAKWQKNQRSQSGHWTATQNGILWVTRGGLVVKRMKDDQSPIGSFDISPDGEGIAWATTEGNVFACDQGKNVIHLGKGRHPVWHPQKKILLYAAARMLGSVVTRYDFKISNLKGQGQWLTHTQHSNESWPTWHKNAKTILYTIEKTTDVYKMDLNNDQSIGSISHSEQPYPAKF